MILISRLLQAHLNGPAQTTTTCWLVQLVNGTVLGFTSLDQPFAFNLEGWMNLVGLSVVPGVLGTGSVTYDAAQGYVPMDVATGSDVSPDNTEIDGVLAHPSITEADLYAGIWDYAAVTVFVVNWSDFFNNYPIVAGTLINNGSGQADFETPAPVPFGLQVGDVVQIFAATDSRYNVQANINVSGGGSPASFGYPITGAPTSPDPSSVSYWQIRMGALILRSGHLGQVSIERQTFKANLQGVDQAYSRNTTELTSPMCRAELGDARCKVPIAPPQWAANTPYAKIVNGDASIGAIVVPKTPLSPNYYQFLATTGGTSAGAEPAWNATIGATTIDGTVVWTCAYAYTIASSVGSVNADNRTIYDSTLIQPGPSGGVAITNITQANPGHVTTASPLGVNSGAAITISGVGGMTEVNTDTVAQNVSTSGFDLPVDTSTFAAYTSGGTVVPLGGTSGFFDYGVLTWVTGLNAGLKMEIRNYQPGQITLQLPMAYAIAPGDTYSMHAGCAKGFLVDCKGRFNNVFNNRSEPYLPGLDTLIQIGKQTAA